MPTPNAALLSLIAQAHDEQWEELDLSGMELSELPLEIDRPSSFSGAIEIGVGEVRDLA